MANTTVRGAFQIHGANPQYLVEKVIRSRIYESVYWKEHCFALTAESLIDKAIELKYIGGVYGNQRPTEFMCLLLKLLQIQPEKEILVEYLLVEEFKYLRALAAMYIRMTFRAVEVFELLEPLLKDFRKLRMRSMAGYTLTFVDEFVDSLLNEERVCDIILPRLTKRDVLEETEGLGPRPSALLDAMEGSGSENAADSRGRGTSSRKAQRSGDRNSDGSRSRSSSSHMSARSGDLRDEGPKDSTARDGSKSRLSENRSRSGSVESRARYVSRSPSRSASRSRSNHSRASSRYRSRSRDISPDRIVDDAS
ncbi:Pre-mRNA-splicing factor 38A [Tulasnella sp. JGI-2019a]|nr:Pre-mRNA-splicing factor 38A [Tulasnella sp. JGI-2019a]KAG9012981.1 Pre-mRNA-splicing factor 38A [Tulasnella sp. JGI-2019a]KAG9036236.1 Pre-mRNA-splicing factor 38A [Tulasnella sp. JGI-2019a]